MMKQFILRNFIITIALLIFFVNSFQETLAFSHKCTKQPVKEDYSKVHIPISFISGKEKCLKYKDEFFSSYYYRNLKEFIITKNNKYCSWGSKKWDEECQDAAMAYAYGDYDEDDQGKIQSYKKFKNAVIDFIKNVKANDIEKALTFTDDKAMFFTDDTGNCLVQEKSWTTGYCRAYLKLKKEDAYGVINFKLFRENLKHIDVDNIRFYLDDLSHSYMYNLVIPYEYKGATKYFDIKFYCAIGGGGPAYPYDNECYPKIYNLGIHSKLPEGH